MAVELQVRSDSRPDPEAARLRAAIRGLVRRFSISERADVSCCGVTVAQAAALEALLGHGPMRLADVGRRLGIAPSTLTRNLERLVEAGLVERRQDSKDARAARVRLTTAGRRAALGVQAREEDFARQVLERIPEDRRALLLDALSELLVAVRGATEACCPGAFDHLMQDFGPACGPGECDCGPARLAERTAGA
jgi:DNA-binding MarR family transcriptional regulator